MSKMSIPVSNASFDAQALREAVNQLLNGEQRSVRFNDLTGTGYFEWDPTGSLRVGKNFENMKVQLNGLQYDFRGFTTGYQLLQSTVERLGNTITAQSRALTDLTTHVELIRRRGDMIESRITADAKASRETLSRVMTTDYMIEVLARDQTKLGASLAVGEGTMSFMGNAIIANASATETLEARVTANEESIEAIASSVTELEASVNVLPRVFLQDSEPDPVSQGPFIVGDMWLDSDDGNKVRVWDGSVWGESIDLVGATVYAQPTPPVSAGLRVGDIWFDTDNDNRQHRWSGVSWVDMTNPVIDATASAVDSLTARVVLTEQGVTANSSAITNLQTSVAGKADASAVNTLSGRVDVIDGKVTSQGSAITTLQNTVANKADISVVNGLNTRLNTAEGNITAQGGAITSLTADVDATKSATATLANPSFELSTGWNSVAGANNDTLPAGVSYQSSTSRTGARCLVLEAPADAVFNRVPISISVDEQLDVSFYCGVIGPTPPNGYIRLSIRWYNAAGAPLGSFATSAQLNTSVPRWRLVSGKTPLPPAGAVIGYLYIQTGHTAGAWAIDDVRVERVAAATAANASALTAMDIRVTANEQAITSSASSITQLQSAIGTAAQGMSVSAGQTTIADWVLSSGSGELAIIGTTNTSVMSGSLLQVGDNNGNDMRFFRHSNLIAYDPNKLYRVRVRGRIDSASAAGTSWYAGLCAMNRDRSSYITTSGTTSGTLASSHYVAVGKTNTAFDAGSEVVGYFKGKVTSGGRTGTGTIDNPWTMPADVAWIGVMAIGNYNNQTGITYIDKLVIEDADAVGDASANATALTALDTRVTSAEGTISAQGTAITQVTATANNNSASVTQLFEAKAGSTAAELLNSGFETNSGWGTNASGNNGLMPAGWAYATSNARSGARCLTIAGNGDLINGGRTSVKAGERFNVKVYARRLGPSLNIGAALRVFIRGYLAGAYVSGSATQVTGWVVNDTSTAYREYSGIYTVPANLDSIALQLTMANITGGNIAVDDVFLERISSTEERSMASVSLLLDVNGRVAGTRTENDGNTSRFAVSADVFEVGAPGGGARTEFSNGNWRVYDAANVMRVRIGVWP